jgi:hypothetical protein
LAKLIISQDGQVVQEVELNRARMTLGRHPRNDIVLQHRAVSGEHAAISMLERDVFLEDLGSTNGTRIKGKRIERHLLSDGDRFMVAVFDLHYVGSAPALSATTAAPAPAAGPVAAPAPARALPPLPVPILANAPDAPLPVASIEVMTGSNAGKKLNLAKPLTTLGSPGVSVLVISRAAEGFSVAHIDGVTVPTVNGAPIGKAPQRLAHGDMIDLAGTRMAFAQESAES